MKKELYDFLADQLDKMGEELESVKDVAKKAELRSRYIGLFIQLDGAVTTNVGSASFDEGPESLEDDSAKESNDVEMEVDFTPKETTAETEAVLPEVEDEDEDPLEDAEEVCIVTNEEGEEVDITEAMTALKDSELDTEDKESIALYLTECACVLQYNEFSTLQHGNDRACMAATLANLGVEDLTTYVLDFSGLEKIDDVFEFITDENAEAIFNFIYE